MIRMAIAFLAINLLFFSGCNSPENASAVSSISVDLMFTDRDLLCAEHAGAGSRKKCESTDESFTFIVDSLPEGVIYSAGGQYDDAKYHLLELSGSLNRSGDASFVFDGTLVAKTKTVLRLNQIIVDSDPRNEKPVFTYTAGTHDIKLKGTIKNWLQLNGG